MKRVDTLTAYRCKFSYLQRNNPLLDEQRKAIQNGEKPNYSFTEFFNDYAEYAINIVSGANEDRAILIPQGSVSCTTTENLTKWHIVPKAGKQGKPVTVIKKSGRQYDFGEDTAALYQHHVFAYNYEDGVIMIFHRQSGSGCKSVFLETSNNFLKTRGIKLEMELILPLEENIAGATPTKLTLQAKRQIVSSDVAENINHNKQKAVVIKELSLNLGAAENNVVSEAIKNMRLGALTKEAAFTIIKAAVEDESDEYSAAEVSLKIGKKIRRIQLDDIERLLGVYEITSQLQAGMDRGQRFVQTLEQLSDEYYEKIVRSKEV